MKNMFLFGLMLNLLLIPGLTLANDGSAQSENPVPTLYSEPVQNVKPVLYAKAISNNQYQVNSAYEAFQVMQKHGLGISQKDYNRFQKKVPSKLDGRIILNVEDKGKAYIVDYKNQRLIYLGKPDNAWKEFKRYSQKSSSVAIKQSCEENNGTWLDAYNECEEEKVSLGDNPLNSTYIIEGNEYTLVDGYAEKEIVPGAASKNIVKVFEANTKGDVNGDGLEDRVVLLTYSAGGSGTFFYVALAVQEERGYKGTEAIFVGDRIAPQTSEIRDAKIIVNYADRKPWESFAERPSVGKSKYLNYENGKLVKELGPLISQTEAEALVAENWGDCKDGECDKLIVNILDGKDGVWYVEAIYDGLKDDSISAERKIASVHYADNKWQWGTEQLLEYKCQDGRGQSDFSEDFCL